MRPITTLTVGLIGLAALFLGVGCTTDELPEPEACPPDAARYSTNIKPIIDASCAYAGCHDGASVGVPGNYTTYSGLLPFLDAGLVRVRVIDQKDDPVFGMPPGPEVYPQSQKADLTPQELELMQCWLNNGYPE